MTRWLAVAGRALRVARPALAPVLGPALVPAVVLLAAAVLVASGRELPPSLAGLRDAGPYAVFAVAIAVAAWFNRMRVLVFAASLLAAHAGQQLALAAGGFAPHAVSTLAALFVPLNVLVALVLDERGVAHPRNARWLPALLMQALFVAWVAAAGRSAFSGAAWMTILDHWVLRAPPTPWAGRILFTAAFVVALRRAWPRRAPLETGVAGALVAAFIASDWADRPGVPAAFMAAAGVLLVVAMLQESRRLAFSDELTGLPGRRALQEALAALGPRYAIAMVDVDRFKKLNDRHGHDVGDQVLKQVAAQLAAVPGGGRAYRYGGEEFALVFAGRSLEEALPHLEAVRAAVAAAPMVVSAPEQPAEACDADPAGAAIDPVKALKVTVSIGAAEPDARRRTPQQVMKAADEALYRAKEGGRNRVVT